MTFKVTNLNASGPAAYLLLLVRAMAMIPVQASIIRLYLRLQALSLLQHQTRSLKPLVSQYLLMVLQRPAGVQILTLHNKDQTLQS